MVFRCESVFPCFLMTSFPCDVGDDSAQKGGWRQACQHRVGAVVPGEAEAGHQHAAVLPGPRPAGHRKVDKSRRWDQNTRAQHTLLLHVTACQEIQPACISSLSYVTIYLCLIWGLSLFYICNVLVSQSFIL